jgi:hypothetical protein
VITLIADSLIADSLIADSLIALVAIRRMMG